MWNIETEKNMASYLNAIYIYKNWISFLKMINVIAVLNFNNRKKNGDSNELYFLYLYHG